MEIKQAFFISFFYYFGKSLYNIYVQFLFQELV